MPSLSETWGTAPDERQLAFPCDEFIPQRDAALYRGVTIHATPEVIFSWLCQMRVAPYSYDLIDNGGRQSPSRLTPGLDELALGQTVMQIFDLIFHTQPAPNDPNKTQDEGFPDLWRHSSQLSYRSQERNELPFIGKVDRAVSVGVCSQTDAKILALGRFNYDAAAVAKLQKPCRADLKGLGSKLGWVANLGVSVCLPGFSAEESSHRFARIVKGLVKCLQTLFSDGSDLL